MSFPAVFDVDNLNGKNGFKIPGLSKGANLGLSVSIGGDLNGDSIDDFIIGDGSGISYVIFGSKGGFPILFDLNTLNGVNGFTISGLAEFVNSVSIGGDVNGDGIDDLLIGQSYACPAVNRENAGIGYVIFGSKLSFPSSFDPHTINGVNGFTIPGLMSGDYLGCSVSIGGDVNGDRIDDLVVGAYGVCGRNQCGASYIIFGHKGGFPSLFDLNTLNGENGFGIPGYVSEGLGFSVSIGGDINGDGIDDILLGTKNSGIDKITRAYVIFGRKGNFPSPFDLNTLNGENGFKISGSITYNSMSMGGDVNGDGIDDIIVIGSSSIGYVIFGSRKVFPDSFDINTINGLNGFKIYGTEWGPCFGSPVLIGGDVNGDGIDDMILGTKNIKVDKIGTDYVIFGSKHFPNLFNLNVLNGTNGFKIPELATGDYELDSSVYIGGDINKDGVNDLLIGIEKAGINETGISYVIFGAVSTHTPTSVLTLTPTPILMQQNYGMLSRIDRFSSINTTDDTGLINISPNREWCNKESLYVGDFNGDRLDDLLCNLQGTNYIMLANNSNYDVVFVPMGKNPDGRMQIGINDQWCFSTYQELFIGDFNGDKKSDLFCRINKGADAGRNYVMLSNSTAFNPMTDKPDGEVKISALGKFCLINERLFVGDFDGRGPDDILCHNPEGVNKIMIPNVTNFISINDDIVGRVQLGNAQGVCVATWCNYGVIKVGDFNSDGKSDLLCNNDGLNMIMLSDLRNPSQTCEFQPIGTKGGTQPHGEIYIGNSSNGWCNTNLSNLVVTDVDGDHKSDLICNELGTNKVMLCKNDDKPNTYKFQPITGRPDTGEIPMGKYDKWCLAQSIFAGDYNGDTLGDLLCNHDGGVVSDPTQRKILSGQTQFDNQET